LAQVKKRYLEPWSCLGSPGEAKTICQQRFAMRVGPPQTLWPEKRFQFVRH
jgi:hypothetical protein